ncbi:MAG: TfoX/Sxy family protein [Planctomycetes bacterium]|nr:TfoX/Sxy family protein [Planctomycetota bacterium]
MDSDFVEYVLRQLRILGLVAARPMFGAEGLYCDDRMFGIVDREVLFFKVSAVTRLDYVAAGMGPFTPLSSKKPMEGYYELPLDVLESPEKLREWGQKAFAAAGIGVEEPKAEPRPAAKKSAPEKSADSVPRKATKNAAARDTKGATTRDTKGAAVQSTESATAEGATNKSEGGAARPDAKRAPKKAAKPATPRATKRSR